MDFFNAQKFFASMFPGKNISYVFDQSCIRQLECIMTDGLPNVLHHVEFQKVKVDIEGMPTQYVPIDPHRANIAWASLKKVISEMQDIYVTDNFLEAFTKDSTADEKVKAREDLKNLTGMSDEMLNSKIQKAQNDAISVSKGDAIQPVTSVDLTIKESE